MKSKARKSKANYGKVFIGAWVLSETRDRLNQRAKQQGRSAAKFIERAVLKELVVE